MSEQRVCPCIECVNFTKSKIKCSGKCKPLEEFNEYLMSCKVHNTDLEYNLFTESSICIRSNRLKYFF